MGEVTQRETLLTCEETMSVQQRHEKLKVEEAVSQQSRVSSTGEGASVWKKLGVAGKLGLS